MEKENHITRPPESISSKTPWSDFNRERFEAELLKLGWVYGQAQGEHFLGRQMPDEIRFIKENKAFYVDNFGAFLYEYGHRIGSISDDKIDANDPSYLCFNYGRKLDLRTGQWVI